MIADTTFLIDLEREVKRRVPGRAATFLSKRGDSAIGMSAVSSAELIERYDDASRSSAMRFLHHFELLQVDSDTAWLWSRLSRQARSEGRTLRANIDETLPYAPDTMGKQQSPSWQKTTKIDPIRPRSRLAPRVGEREKLHEGRGRRGVGI